MLALLALIVQAAGPVRVSVMIERDRIPVGDEVLLTVRATTTESGPIRVDLPQVAGLELVDRTDRIEPLAVDSRERAYTLDLRLRGVAVGEWRYEPLTVFVGDHSELAPGVVITVTGSTAVSNPTSNPRLLGLIQRAPPPNPGPQATIAVIVSSADVVRGEQLDVLTLAWFPRSIRARLRRPPTLNPPVLAGVWSVPQPAIPGVLANRAAGDDVYDLFVSHQIAYPLAPGRLTIPPARVEYAIPMSRRQGERSVEARSQPVTVIVNELPGGGPAGFTGPVARSVEIEYRVRNLPARAGELLPVDVVVSGSGNLPFWPAPGVAWPVGSRAYLDGVRDDTRLSGGLLGGSKSYRYLLLTDSVGSIALGELRYPYFDPSVNGFREARTAGMVLPVLPAIRSGPRRQVIPLVSAVVDWPARAQAVTPGGLVWWIAVGLVVALAAAAIWRRRRRTRRVSPAESPRGGVELLERMFLVLSPDGGERGPEDFEVALRRAGVERDMAGDLIRLRNEADRVRFGRDATPAEPALDRAARETLARLPRAVRRRLGVTLALMAVLIPVGYAQQPDPAKLYREGAYPAAADGFRARAKAEPTVWQHWYDVAASEYLGGRDAAAAAALVRALELAPRARLPRQLWETMERKHQPPQYAAVRFPLSDGERWLIVLGLTLAVALAAVVRPRARRSVVVPAAILVSVAIGLWIRDARRDHAGGLTVAQVELKQSPHGLATARGALPALSMVSVEQIRAEWMLVRDRAGMRGWLPRASVAAIRGLD